MNVAMPTGGLRQVLRRPGYRGGDSDAASMLEWMRDFKIFEKEAIRVYMTTVLKLTEIFPRGRRYRPEMTFCLYCPNINTNAEGGKDCRRARLIGEAVNVQDFSEI